MKKILSAIFALGMVASLAGCNKGQEKAKDDPNKIKEVEVTDFRAPKYNDRVFDLACSYSYDSDKYCLDNTSFFYNKNGQETKLLDDDHFTFDVEYTVQLTFVADGGEDLYFAKNATVKINGEVAEGEKIVSEDGKELVYRKTFDAIESTIHHIEIGNVKAPVVGEQSYYYNLTISDDTCCHIDYGNTYWLKGNIYFDGVFEAGNTYGIRITLEPTYYRDINGDGKHCVFADDFTATINGQDADKIDPVGAEYRDRALYLYFPAL